MGADMTKLAKMSTKSRIIHAAMGIAHSEGARHLTIDAVTVKSGLSKGGVLYHFPSKMALLEGLVIHTLEGVREQIETHMSCLRGRPNATLHALSRFLGDVLDETLTLPVALLAASAENPALLEPVRAEFREIWQALRSETTNEPRALVIWHALEGMQFLNMMGLTPDGKTQLRQCLAEIRTMIDELPGKERKSDL